MCPLGPNIAKKDIIIFLFCSKVTNEETESQEPLWTHTSSVLCRLAVAAFVFLLWV